MRIILLVLIMGLSLLSQPQPHLQAVAPSDTAAMMAAASKRNAVRAQLEDLRTKLNFAEDDLCKLENNTREKMGSNRVSCLLHVAARNAEYYGQSFDPGDKTEFSDDYKYLLRRD